MCLGPLPFLWLKYQGFPGKLKESFMEVWSKSIRSIAVYISASPAHPFLACPVLPKLGPCLERGTCFSFFFFVLNTLGLAMLRPLYFFMGTWKSTFSYSLGSWALLYLCPVGSDRGRWGYMGSKFRSCISVL